MCTARTGEELTTARLPACVKPLSSEPWLKQKYRGSPSAATVGMICESLKMEKPMVLAPAAFATATLQAVALKGNAGPATNGIADSACIRRSLRTRSQEHDGIKMGIYVVFILSTTNIKPVITDLFYRVWKLTPSCLTV